MAGSHSSKAHWVVALAVLAPLAVIFGATLSGRYGFAYRDAAHFYYPLFDLVRGEWAAGRVPLWNAYENLGVPLAGDATSGVFYPGKLLFALPLDTLLLTNWFVVAHVALAAYTSFRLARRLGATPLAAGLAGLSYAFSGSVMFQYSNVVFLVGAAWLPLALELADRMIRASSWRGAVGLGIVLALMVTGGDAQMAYNAGLLAALDAVILWRSAARSTASAPRRSFRLLALAAASGLLLSAVQVLPAWESARHSVRAAHAAPRSLYELVTRRQRPDDERGAPWSAGLLGTSSDEHTQAIYQFNVGLWRAIEFVWPNVAGRHFPVNGRWLDVLPAEGRVWTPSIYMGLLPFVLALGTFSVRLRASPGVRWMSWMTLLAALAGLGVFGLVWWIREVAGWFGVMVEINAGDEVGGLYWLMTVVLPGYVYFRYPAKLLVVASLGLSVLAALGWDQLWKGQGARWWRVFAGIAAASVALLCLAGACWPWVCARLASIPPNELYGPFDCQAAWVGVRGALVQTSLVAALFAVLLHPLLTHWHLFAWLAPSDSPGAKGGDTSRGVIPRVPRIVPAVCLLLTAAELVVSQRVLVPLAPAAMWKEVPESIEQLNAAGPLGRVYRDPQCWNDDWRTSSSPQRLQECLAWERSTLHPKYHLPFEIALAETRGTLAPYEMHVVWEVARGRGAAHGGWPAESLLGLLGVSSALVPASLAQHAQAVAPGAALVSLSSPLPRAWIIHDVHSMSELAATGNSPAAVTRRTEDVLFPADRVRDWSREAVVETDSELPPFAEPTSDRSESCEIVAVDPQRVEIDVELTSPGLVVLADAFYPGWTLAVETDGVVRDVPILRTNRVMRGCALAAGRHRLVYRYRPWTLIWGAVTSAATCLALIAMVGVNRRK